MKPQCPLPISVVSSDDVAHVNHILVISNDDGSCENLSLGSPAKCASSDHLDGNGSLDSFSEESQDVFFFFSLSLI